MGEQFAEAETPKQDRSPVKPGVASETLVGTGCGPCLLASSCPPSQCLRRGDSWARPWGYAPASTQIRTLGPNYM